MNSLGKVVV